MTKASEGISDFMSRSLPSKLYKYRTGARQDLDSFADRYVWAASLGSLNDPCEAIIEVKCDCVIPWLVEFQVSCLRRGGVCSFAKSSLDSRCWAYYAANYSGYCVEYDVQILTDGLYPGEGLLIEVQYVESPPIIDLWASIENILLTDREEARYRIAQATMGMKARGWQHEGEWRLITMRPGRIAHAPGGVTGVYLGSKMDARMRTRVSRRAERQGIPLFEVTASNLSYQLNAKRL
jgi:Protein of unknown function (DUF2971)